MTRRFFWIILLLLLLWVGASYYGYAVFRISMILLFAVLLFSILSVLYLRTRVKLDPMRYNEEITRLDTAKYSLQLSSKSLLLPAQLRMIAWSSQSHETILTESRLLNLTVRPGESRELVATLEGIHCGSLELGEIDLRVRDTFNVFWMRIPGIEKHLRFTTLVLPRLYYKQESATLVKELIDEGEYARISTFDTSDEIDTLRELQPGDTMRRIHWKVSARIQKFMIKQYEDPREIRYYVVLDPAYNEVDLKDIKAREKENFARDDMLELTASIISVLLDQKQWVELETWHPARMFQASNEVGHLNYFRRQLALLPQKSERSMESQIERLNVGSSMSYYIFVVRSLTPDLARQIASLQKYSLGLMLCLMETSADPAIDYIYEELSNNNVRIVQAKDIIQAKNLRANTEEAV
ncbi:MAG TPA: DUF58 domain-containing protein [Clostridiaceae bacterium]|nr:DUF58 domain-containing protein [Clostridiaceae bacterium]